MVKDLKTILDDKRRNISLSAIGKEIGITRQYVSYLLRGKRKNPTLLAKIKAIMKREGLI